MSLKQISAMEDIMRIAINGQKHVDSLVGYYRDQIDKFNCQRAEWALNYQLCKDNASNLHLLEREIALSKTRIQELEENLGMSKANLTHERQKYYRKLQENEQIKNNLEQSKRKLREMTAICKPINVNLPKSQGMTNSRINQSSSLLKDNNKSAKGELELELINITRQHQKKKMGIQGHIEVLKNEMEQLLSEHSNRGNQNSHQYKQALNKMSEVESRIMNLTIEFFKLRMEKHQDQTKLQEENEIIRLKTMQMAKKLQVLQESHSSEFKAVDKEVKKKNQQFRLKYDEELKKKQQHLTILKQQNERINDIYLNKLKKLQQELRQNTQKHKVVDEKSRTEVGSLKNQIKILRKRLENEGIKRMRQEIAEGESEEEDDSSLSMSQLQEINREVNEIEKKI